MKSVSEIETKKLFLKYKKRLLSTLGNKALYGNQIYDICKELLGNKFKGVYAINTVDLNKQGYCIVNTAKNSGKGEHWISLYITKKNVYYYDSFSRPSNKLIKLLNDKITKKGLCIKQSDIGDVEQSGFSEVCGILCISWLCVCKNLGIRNAMKI
mgnify:CR=1 FL=1